MWYFAYGSNMAPAIFLGRRAMRPEATRRARVDGLRLCFSIPIGPGERGVANLAADPAACTHGVAYRLANADAERLDRSEGVPAGVYHRVPVQIAFDDETPVSGFTYRSTIVAPNRKPSARYLGLLLEGARVHGLAPEWIHFLESFELAVDEREPTR